MHTHLDDGDWQAAIRRYKESTALPAEYLVPALSQLREKFNDTGEELRSAGPSLQQVIREAGVPADESFDPQQDWINQDTDACSLIEKVRSRNVSVIDVVERHLRMAAIAQQILGCYSEIFFDGARARAKEIDKRIQAGQDCGRLCGLPISIKAHQSLNGSGSDRGFVFDVLDPITVQSLIEEETKSGAKGISKSTLRLLDMQGPHTQVTTSAQIKALLDEGAIIIAKTVMPQSVMQLDTKSNLHGQCLNPYNVHLSPGGSSGGESASVSSGSTMMGIGSDIGGSVRQPAAVTGLYGIRCTTGRIGLDGVRTTMPGNQGIPATIGPLCRSRRDLRLVTEILISRTIHVNPFTTPPLPWRKVEAQTPSKRKLRVGILRDDGVALPITPIRRALEHAIVKLSGVDSVELIYCPQDDIYGRGWDLTRELYFMEDGQLIKALAKMTGEPIVPLTNYILSPPVRDHTTSESWELQYARDSLKMEYWNKVWVKEDLDVLLCPASHLCAPRAGQIKYWGYTSFFNLVDMPGAVFPIKSFFADAKTDEAYERSGASPSSHPYYDSGRYHDEAKAEYENHRDTFNGAPIGLQLIGKRHLEEELLSALELIDTAINGV